MSFPRPIREIHGIVLCQVFHQMKLKIFSRQHNETPMSDASKIAISPAYLNELKALIATTSPGPWTSFVEGRDHDSGSSFIRTGAEDIELDGATSHDQDFVARAHQDIPLLIAEIERLQALILSHPTAAE